MTVHYTLMSHGTVLGRTGAAFSADELPPGACVWHFLPTLEFDVVEPIIAELSAPAAIELVEDVIPTRDEYLHPAVGEHEAQLRRAMAEAARVHHFRLVLERYERLGLELRDDHGRRVPTDGITVAKQSPAAGDLDDVDAAADRDEAATVDDATPVYFLMAHLRSATAAAASAA